MGHRKSRRITPASAYIGAGNRTSVFTRKSRRPFQDLHEVYLKEAKNLKESRDEAIYAKLTDHEKQIIRKRIKNNEVRLFVIKLSFSILLTLLFASFLIWIIKNFCC